MCHQQFSERLVFGFIPMERRSIQAGICGWVMYGLNTVFLQTHIFQAKETGNMDSFAKKLWEHDFGNTEVAHDFTGCEIRRSAYGQRDSRFGWDIDHILPQSQGGSDAVFNLQITHIETNAERGNKNSFWIDGALYQVKRVSRLYQEDNVANYPYEERDKKYCIVIVENDNNNDDYDEDD